MLAAAGGTLQVLGPPREVPGPQAAATPAPQPVAPVPAPVAPAPAVQSPPAQAAVPVRSAEAASASRPGRATPGPIADPDPALREAVDGSTTDFLPRISEDGRPPMQVYAAGFDRSSRRARVGLLVAGLGLNQADSEAAIRSLPGGVTLAFSPYAQNTTKLLAAARAGEHEFLLSIPMEPQGFPLNDPGPHALMTTLSREENRPRLDWALSRIAGYAGVTGALGNVRGERFASVPDQMQPVLAELAHRGLLYVDPRPGAAPLPLVWDRSIDLIVDEPDGAADIDAKLTQLSKLAREKGSALGLVMAPRPIAIQRIASWANGLMADGLILAPVSALVQEPAKQAAQ
jgi:polysaccharide deacetylase 2 family uncharacterized protein YibQ